MRTRWLAVAAATSLVVAASYLGWPGRARRDSPAAREPPPGGSALVPSPTDRAELDRLIRAYEAQVRETPNVTALDLLGELYLAKARATGALEPYRQASAAADRALALAPGHLDAQAVLARTSLALHEFSSARTRASEVLATDPARLEMLAVVADASLELGDVDAAAVALDTLARRLPGSASVTARRARLAFVKGDAAAASALARRAEGESAATGEGAAARAFYPTLAGSLAFAGGRYDEAGRAYARALAAAPTDRVALAGAARVLAARGDRRGAIERYERAVAVVPDPAILAPLGDLYELTGRDADARRVFSTIDAIGALEPVYSRPVVIFLADHRLRAGDAVDAALADLARGRRDVYAYDAAAWALLAAGRVDEAVVHAREALRHDTPDPMLRYHAGMVFAAAGEREPARRLLRAVLSSTPDFDPVHAPRARAALRRLEAAR